MGIKEVGNLIGADMNEQDQIKTQFGSSDVTAYFELFDDEVSTKDRGLRINQRILTGNTLIWGHPTGGIWGTNEWGDDASAFGNWSINRIIHPNRRYIDNFNDDFFKDTTNTNANWGTTGTINFTGGSLTASSLTVYKNNETINSATLTAVDSGNINYEMSADTGSNWESVSSGKKHTYTNTGQELKWRATATSNANISSIEIEY